MHYLDGLDPAILTMTSSRELDLVVADLHRSADPRLVALSRRAAQAGEGPDRLAAREAIERLRVELRNAWEVADRAATRREILDRHLGAV